MIGCVAFGVSALGAFVTDSGVTEEALLANLGTFIGALCFLVAAFVIRPRHSQRRVRRPPDHFRFDSTGTTGIATSGSNAQAANATG